MDEVRGFFQRWVFPYLPYPHFMGLAPLDSVLALLLRTRMKMPVALWPRLTRFLEHPELELSNNLAENSMRPVAIGRKNWIHVGSPQAGPKIAAIFSIVESCRKLNVPIRQYLADVLPGLADHSIQSLAELAPAAYAARMAK